MKFRLAACGVLVCGVVVWSAGTSHSQDELPNPFRPSDDPLVSLPASVPAPELTPQAGESPSESLRSQYLDLARVKAELMDEDALAAEIQTEKIAIDNLKAHKKLHEAQKILASIVEEFPNSAAAKNAEAMLNFARQQRPRDFGEPVPDRRFSDPRWNPPIRAPERDVETFDDSRPAERTQPADASPDFKPTPDLSETRSDARSQPEE